MKLNNTENMHSKRNSIEFTVACIHTYRCVWFYGIFYWNSRWNTQNIHLLCLDKKKVQKSHLLAEKNTTLKCIVSNRKNIAVWIHFLRWFVDSFVTKSILSRPNYHRKKSNSNSNIIIFRFLCCCWRKKIVILKVSEDDWW